MRIIFSRDRAAQLELLLRSLDENCAEREPTIVIFQATSLEFRAGYDRENGAHDVEWIVQSDFNADLRDALDFGDAYVTFLCDDDVLYRPVPALYDEDAMTTDVLAFSVRLPALNGGSWQWRDRPPHDHGYPGSIDGHTFRVDDVEDMLYGQFIENPLMLETILAQRCHAFEWERPLMAAYPDQALVGVPVNSVADQRGRPHGDYHPQDAAELNRRFLRGERIDLDALDFSGVNGCLHEVPFQWTPQ